MAPSTRLLLPPLLLALPSEDGRGVLANVVEIREGEMREITVTKKALVPDGRFCCERDGERCEHIRPEYTKVSWSDGLGSPGTLTLYWCRILDWQLHDLWEEQSTKGFRLAKCKPCLEAKP